MPNEGSTSGVVRRATPNDRKDLLSTIGTAFARPGDKPADFSAYYPHLFTDERIGNHIVFVDQGRMLGAVGLYPFDLRYGSTVFRSAGVGQVCTLPEARGRGVMNAMMNEASRSIYEQKIDLAWLAGDRLRYGHFGYARGGAKIRFDFWDRYLPPPPEQDVRRFDPVKDFALMRRALGKEPCEFIMSDSELRLWLKPTGWVLNDAFIYTDGSGETTVVADGSEEDIVRLLAHQLAQRKKAAPDKGRIAAETAVQPTALLRVCQRHYSGYTVQSPASFRVGVLASFLEKACHAAEAKLGKGSGSLSLINSDTGEAATISCENGRAKVSATAAADAHRFTTTELSEIFFGPVAIDVLLPTLPQDSPIRRILPMPVCRSAFFLL